MASANETAGFYLVISGRCGERAPLCLAEALVLQVPASVMIEPAPELTDALLAGLIRTIQNANAAAMILSDATLAREAGADGVHLPPSKSAEEAYAAARDVAGSRAIVGADAGRSRHDAMTLGELGADYIGFGIPARVEDRDTARERQLNLIAWWSEIFEVPCVAFDVETPEHASRLIAAGADFIAVRLPETLEPANVKAHLKPFLAALRRPIAEPMIMSAPR
jgi:thiamine-phosphate pyrophosphorylase